MRSYDQRSKIWSWTSWQSSQSNVSLTCNANWQGCNKNLLRAMVIHLLHSLPTHSSRRLRQERRFKPDFERIFHPNTRRYSTMNRIPKAKERGEEKKGSELSIKSERRMEKKYHGYRVSVTWLTSTPSHWFIDLPKRRFTDSTKY